MSASSALTYYFRQLSMKNLQAHYTTEFVYLSMTQNTYNA
jgi:hypothetical protein